MTNNQNNQTTGWEVMAKISISLSIMVYIAMISLTVETSRCTDFGSGTGIIIKFQPSHASEWLIAAGFLALGNISGWAVDPKKIKKAINNVGNGDGPGTE